jgi:hypothetical protein
MPAEKAKEGGQNYAPRTYDTSSLKFQPARDRVRALFLKIDLSVLQLQSPSNPILSTTTNFTVAANNTKAVGASLTLTGLAFASINDITASK